MMGRLTRGDDFGFVALECTMYAYCCEVCTGQDNDCRGCEIQKAFKKLSAYEDLGTVEELQAALREKQEREATP